MKQGYSVNTYEVTTSDGEVHTIESRWMFHENGALLFRHGERGNSRVIAAFAPGIWLSMKVVEEPKSTEGIVMGWNPEQE